MLKASIFAAELYAVMETINIILRSIAESGRYAIFSYSRSAIMAFKSTISTFPISQKVREFLQKAQAENARVELCLVPRDAGVQCNEKVDTAARKAA